VTASRVPLDLDGGAPRLARIVALAAALAACPACGGPSASPVPAASLKAPGPAPRFAFQALDGRAISSESLSNRVTGIAFLTTYDVHSQAEARLLAQIERHHSPRVNVVALVLEAPENRPLVEAFVVSLGIGYPVALAGLHHVPSVVVLDRAGQEAWRHVGFVGEAALDAAVRAVEASSPPPREPSL
jgi:hypothetical protein